VRSALISIRDLVVLSQNLNPDVLMMQSAEDWYRCDGAELLRAPKIRRILVQREMRADLIVIRSVILQHATQLRFVEHDQVSRLSRRIEPMTRSTWPFCHGERGAVG